MCCNKKLTQSQNHFHLFISNFIYGVNLNWILATHVDKIFNIADNIGFSLNCGKFPQVFCLGPYLNHIQTRMNCDHLGMVPTYPGIECLNRVNIYKHCWQQLHQHQHPDMQQVPRFARKNCPRKACKYRQFRCFFVVKFDWKTFSRGLYSVQDQMLKNTQRVLWNGKHIPKNHEQTSDFILSPMDCTDRPNVNKNIIAIFGTFCMSASRNIQHQSCLLNNMIDKARQWQNLNPTLWRLTSKSHPTF